MGKRHKPQVRLKEKPSLETVDQTQTQLRDTRLARALASVDERTRNRAIASVLAWLSKQSREQKEVEKLWMALYFCFWHTDHNNV